MPSDINYYAISKTLRGKIKKVKQARFGNFPLLETTGEVLRSQSSFGRAVDAPDFSYDQDKVVVRAFEDVRQGAAPDAILWDKGLAQAFFHRCRGLGLVAPDAYLGRRLINVRKNSPRYKKHGIEIASTTKSEPHPSIVPQYAHVIEFALVRLRYRYGASIDDILLDPELGGRFEELTSQIVSEIGSQELRLGALYIRKTRYLQKSAIEAIKGLNTHVVEEALGAPVALAHVRPEVIPPSPGLIEIKEPGRYLYISRNGDLRSAVSQIRTGRGFEIVSNGFWKPDPEVITLQVATGERIGGVGIGVWERRLIHDYEPVFNWPMQKTAA
jgi:hypothetical protein